MTVLNITVDEKATEFSRTGGHGWYRRWFNDTKFYDGTAVEHNAARCALDDVLDGITEIRITLRTPVPTGVPSIAYRLYDEILKLLSAPPEGTKDFSVSLHDVKNSHGVPVYPAPWTWPRQSVQLSRTSWRAPERKVGKMPELGMGYGYGFGPDAMRKAYGSSIEARTLAWMYGGRSHGKETVLRINALARRVAKPERPTLYMDLETLQITPKNTYRVFWDEATTVDWKPFFAMDDSAAPKAPPKPDYSKMVLRIGEDDCASLRLPTRLKLDGADNREGLYWRSASDLSNSVAGLAKKLRELKVRELTLRRHRSSVPMQEMTEWLTAVVNASSPVMKIISDPEPLT